MCRRQYQRFSAWLEPVSRASFTFVPRNQDSPTIAKPSRLNEGGRAPANPRSALMESTGAASNRGLNRRHRPCET